MEKKMPNKASVHNDAGASSTGAIWDGLRKKAST
jgi:hypothetical protein